VAALLRTAPLQQSGDLLFSQFKQQNYVELCHRQWKTPLAVRTVLQQIGLDARHLEIPGRRRLEIDIGKPIHEILT
jgi:hypothetical protein